MLKFDDKDLNLCACGCEKKVRSPKNKYLHGHYTRINTKLQEIKKSKKYREKMSLSTSGCKNGNYKGIGIYTCYQTYYNRLKICEEIAIDKDNTNLLNVRCTYCGRWFKPTRTQSENRLNALRSTIQGEQRFYCSKNCKNLCPSYGQYKYFSGYKKKSSTEINPELRKIVFERDNWECQKCNLKESLECHHIDPISIEPIFANDHNSCITLCKDCHKEIHMRIEGCKYSELRNCLEVNIV